MVILLKRFSVSVDVFGMAKPPYFVYAVLDGSV
jgi:hypothetical protein